MLRIVAAVGCVVLALTTAACSSTNPVSPTPTPTSHFDGIAPPELDPLAAYAQNPDNLIALQRATDILTDRCMKKFGFGGFQPTNYDDLRASFQEGDGRLYGITDAKVAAVYGFMPAPSATTAPPPAEATSETYHFVLTGLKGSQTPASISPSTSPGKVGKLAIPPAGCLGEARKKLTGQISGRPTGDASLGQVLDVQAWQEAWGDAVTEKAKDDWSACMEVSGYRMHDPLDDIPERKGTSEKADKAEIREALADIKCKKDTKFVQRANAENVVVANRYLEKNQLALQESKDFNDDSLKRANKVINASN